MRERPVDEVLAAVDAMVERCGFEEVSFLSLSSSDYTYVEGLVRRTLERHGDQRLSIGLPSLRIESFSVELMDLLEKGRRRSGFTLRPKPPPTACATSSTSPSLLEDLLRTAEEVYSRGWTTIKMYFDRPSHPDAGRRAGHRRPRQRGPRRGPAHHGRQGQGANRRQHARTQAAQPFQWAAMEDEP